MLIWLLLLTAAAVQSRPATPPRDAPAGKAGAGSCAIAGRITEQETGRPLPRAIVTLISSSGSRRFEAVADAEGRYEFTGLEPGDYGISAGPAELSSTHLGQALGQSAPMDRGAARPRFGLELKTGERRQGVDIALARALAIEGRVLDPWDEPMAEVEIGLVRADGTAYPTYSIHSDDRGEYRLYGLKPGRYRVCVTPETPSDYRSDTSRVVRTCHPSSTGEGNGADVILTTTDVPGIDVRVQRQGTHRVSGLILDAAGHPVDKAGINALSMDDRHISSYGTSTGGTFELRGLIAGRYLLRASIGGGADPSDPRPPTRERETGYTSVDVGATDVSGVVIPLSKMLTLSGRVLFDGGPAPSLSQARMVVHAGVVGHALTRLMPSRPPVAPIGDNLTFELKELTRLPMVVVVTGMPAGWVVKAVRYGGEDIAGVATDFGTRPEPRRMEIVLTNRVAEPEVRVTDERGVPLTTYRVVLFSTDPARWNTLATWIPNAPSKEGVTKLGPTLPGDYFLAALSADDNQILLEDRTRLADLASAAARVTFAEKDNRTLDLRLTSLPAARR